jgi:hypothetical protein
MTGALGGPVREVDDEGAHDPPPRVTARPSRPLALAVLAVLCLQFLVIGLLEAHRDSVTVDEAFYVVGGLTALRKHELRISTGQPPLGKLVAALPALLASADLGEGRAWQERRTADYTAEFVTAHARRGDLQRIVFLARIVPVLEGVLVGVVAYALASTLFGRKAGLLASGLWLTMPFATAFSHLDGLDLPFTLAVLVSCWCLCRWQRAPSAGRALVLGLALGGALLTRTTGLFVLAAVAAAVIVFGRDRRAFAHVLLIVVVAWASVWVCIRGVAPHAPDRPVHHEFFSFGAPPNSASGLARRVAKIPPWPREYEESIDDAFNYNTSLRAAGFLLGARWVGARWWFWPAAMAVKLPPGTIVVLLTGLGAWVWLDPKVRRRAVAVLLLPAGMLTYLTLIFPAPTGLRYFLPAIPLALVASSAVARTLRGRPAAVLLTLVGVTQLAFLWESVPHSLAWTAPPFRPAYRVVTGSDVDWGQDLPLLMRWAEHRRPLIAYSGGVDPLRTGQLPTARPLPDVRSHQIKGWVAVSVNHVNKPARQFSWLRAYCPVDDLGGSILIYRFIDPPSSRPGPSTPAAPCRGAAQSTRQT